MIAWVFPGQGSQFVGMGTGFSAAPAREVFDVAREVLGWDVRSVCLHGPEELLASTEVSQPAILTVSVAAARSLEDSGLLPDLVAGHSVGEFAALVVARAISFEDALHVVGARAEAMAQAGRETAGRMAAVIGLDRGRGEEICERSQGLVAVATVNGSDQMVISGEVGAVEASAEAARAAGARRVIPLPVSVAAHSPLMAPAAKTVGRALEGVTLLPPVIPFSSGVAGKLLDEPSEIGRSLVDALTHPVDWPACVAALQAGGAEAFVEVGPGAVLSGLIRRLAPDVQIWQVADDRSAARLVDELASGVLR